MIAMRLLFVSHSFPPVDAPLENVGGMQRVAMDLFEQLRRHPQVEVHGHVLRAPWEKIVRHAAPFIVGLVPRLPALVARHRIDTVLFASMTSALPAVAVAPALRAAGVRVASICHGLDVTEPNFAYQTMVKRTLRTLDGVLPVSRATGRTCEERGMPSSRIHVVPNGVDLERFGGVFQRRQRGERPSATPFDDLPDDAFLCVSVGRQVRRKGFSWFVDEVMPKLPDLVHYWLAGDGPERTAIEGAIDRRRLRHRIKLLGLVEESTLRDLYVRANQFVMPNIVVPGDMEGFGIVMIEAGICGVPTVAADLEGIRDVIDEASGRLVTSGDASAFAKAITRAAQLEPERRAALAEATHHHVRANFAWSGVVEQYVVVLGDLRPRGWRRST